MDWAVGVASVLTGATRRVGVVSIGERKAAAGRAGLVRARCEPPGLRALNLWSVRFHES